MNSLDRVRATLAFKVPDVVPVIPQNCVMAIQFAGYDMIEASKDGAKLASAMLECREKFGYDGHMMGPDAVILAEALGVETEYREDNPPAAKSFLLEKLEDFRKLKIVDPQKDGRMPQWLKAARALVEKDGRDSFVVARADQCGFSLACLLRGIENFLLDLIDPANEKTALEFLEFCTDCHIAFARALKDTGVHALTCGDSYGGPSIVGPSMYERFVLPFEKKATAAVQEELGLPYFIHICGSADSIADEWVTTGAAVFEVDHKTNIELIREKTYGKTTIFGNLDTYILHHCEPQKVHEALDSLYDVMAPLNGFILSSGCSMMGNAKPENLHAMVEYSRSHAVSAEAI